jgi:phospholipase C
MAVASRCVALLAVVAASLAARPIDQVREMTKAPDSVRGALWLGPGAVRWAHVPLRAAGCPLCPLSPSLRVTTRRAQVEHIVIFMQENRAYDHYYGTLKGVRGFNDRAVPTVRSGLNTLYQPVNQSDLSLYQLPFPINTLTTSGVCTNTTHSCLRSCTGAAYSCLRSCLSSTAAALSLLARLLTKAVTLTWP